MAYTRNSNTVPDDNPGGDSVQQAIVDRLSVGVDNVFTHLNDLDGRVGDIEALDPDTMASTLTTLSGTTVPGIQSTLSTLTGTTIPAIQSTLTTLNGTTVPALDSTLTAHVGAGGGAHADVTTSADGFMTAADKSKLDGIATSANNYSHPTGDGNLHVPATSTTNNGKYLQAGSSAGSLSWAALDFTVDKSVTGYQKLPSGLIFQWGTKTSIPAQNVATVTFPLEFPNAVFCITATKKQSAYNAYPITTYPDNVAQFTIYNSHTSSADAYWFAIGH
jgi:hypothetical protein